MTKLSGNSISSIDRNDARYLALLAAHERLARKDSTLWGPEAAIEAAVRLNWIDLPEASRELLPALDALSAKHRDKSHIVLCGMGGSSLGPEVIARTFDRELFILDSTDPQYISHIAHGDASKMLVVVSSKSGATIETASQRAFFQKLFVDANLAPQDHIVIVTDPGSPLDITARADGYSVINADPHVGGRFSVLSAFGLVPSALIGVDVSVLLDNASETKAAFLKDPTIVVDMAYAIAYKADQYMTFCDGDAGMPGLSDWVEQLVAESTGKNQVGRLPIVIEREKNDNVFSVAYSGKADLVIESDLASQFIIWEWVTALVGFSLGIDPFNQPNVTEAKVATATLLDAWSGVLPTFSPAIVDGTIEIFGTGDSLVSAIKNFISEIPHEGYVAVMAYLDRISDSKIVQLRELLSEKSHRPVTFGWGPRFLHSTGQFHKGGQQNGAFLQITGDVAQDFEIPGQAFGFKTLIMAQALGDAAALEKRKYPLLRLNLTNRSVGIDELLNALKTL